MAFAARSRMAGLVVFALLCAPAGSEKQAGPQSLPAQPKVKAPPPTPIAEEKDDLGKPSWDPEWNKIVEDALPPELLSSRVARDVRPFCPRFKRMSTLDKRAFWAYFFQALAGAEASLVPTTDVRHAEMDEKDTVTLRMVRAEGLLQLTYMDADRYGCNFDWEKDRDLPERDPRKTILQPANNLTCGVKILDDQLIVKHKRLSSPSSYWGTLRPGTAGYQVFAKQMTNVPAYCRSTSRFHRWRRRKAIPGAPASEAARKTSTSAQ